MPQNILYRLPDGLAFEHAAMIEAVSIAVHAVNLTPRALGDTAVVVGSGMIGQLTVQAAKVAGSARLSPSISTTPSWSEPEPGRG